MNGQALEFCRIAFCLQAGMFALFGGWCLAVDLTEIEYQDRPHYLVRTETSLWYYDRAGGGFSRCIDRDGRDWIAFQKDPLSDYPASAAAGYRGIPNCVFVGPDKGAGHPGFNRCRSTLVQKNVIRTESLSGKWQWSWTFGERAATFRMERADPDQNWWFLYEGPIAGSFEPRSKSWATLTEGLRNDVPNNQSQFFGNWQTLYVADHRLARTMVIHQHQADKLQDTYWYLGSSQGGSAEAPDGMVVVGFGRGPKTQPLLQGSGHTFSLGLVEQELTADLIERNPLQLLADIAPHPEPEISFWYGDQQSFGKYGMPQRWINILGNIASSGSVRDAEYRLDGGAWTPLSLGSDLHRLARAGDFNVELPTAGLAEGEHHLEVAANSQAGERITASANFQIHQSPATWPLPYSVDFSETGFQRAGIDAIHQAAQIVDGKWKLEADGLRTVEPWYDRVLAVGSDWSDFDAQIRLTIHSFTPPQPGPPTYNVSHCGVALRWPGHTSDGRQPSRQWYPMGCQGELLLRDPPTDCRWRALPGVDRGSRPVYAERSTAVPLGLPIFIRAQVQTLKNGDSRYRFKHWNASDEEPDEWYVTQVEAGNSDIRSGSLAIVPHNSDITLHAVHVTAL